MNEETYKTAEQVAKYLSSLANGRQAPKKHIGICTNIRIAMHRKTGNSISGIAIVKHYCVDWPHYSGHPTYPLRNKKTGTACYPSNWRDYYGKMRRSLCKHIAKRIREDIAACTLPSNIFKIKE